MWRPEKKTLKKTKKKLFRLLNEWMVWLSFVLYIQKIILNEIKLQNKCVVVVGVKLFYKIIT